MVFSNRVKWDRSGANNPNWKGGHKENHGYITILKRGHPRADIHGYVFEHIVVYEQYHKCCILRSGHVHHIDKNKKNNHIGNLVLLKAGAHIAHHHIKDMTGRSCFECGRNYSSSRRWNWNKERTGLICGTCYMTRFRKLNPNYYNNRRQLHLGHMRAVDNVNAAKRRLRKRIFNTMTQ